MDKIIEQRILANTRVKDETKVAAPFKLYFHVYALILGKLIMRVMKDEVDGHDIPQSYLEIGNRSGLFLGSPSGPNKLFGAEVRDRAEVSDRDADAQEAAILEERILFTLLGVKSHKGDIIEK
eukprot:scaffold7267_cov41-Cyclotella_meneghiniana.AAC.1